MKAIVTVLLLIVAVAGLSYVLHGTNKFSGKLAFAPDADDHFTIQIQPFDDFPSSQSQYVFKAVKKLYGNTILLKSVKLPARSYYKPRNRYRADSIIQWLSDRTPRNHVTLGLTSKDISTTKEKIVDWGVMGLGFQPGNACVVSTFRLNKKNLRDQLFKVSVHELGHTQGLEHCENKTCFMRDAEGHNTTDEEHEFCPRCKKRLEDKGWIFSN